MNLESNFSAKRIFLDRAAFVRALRFDELLDCFAQLCGKCFSLTRGHSFCLDWLTRGERQAAGIEVVGMNREQIENSTERYGHQRDLGANGQVRRTGKERLQFAGGGAPAFRERQKVAFRNAGP